MARMTEPGASSRVDDWCRPTAVLPEQSLSQLLPRARRTTRVHALPPAPDQTVALRAALWLAVIALVATWVGLASG